MTLLDGRRSVVGLVLCIVLFALSFPTNAQQTGKIARIGFLDTSTGSESSLRFKAFWQEINRLGWIQGKTLTVEYRFA